MVHDYLKKSVEKQTGRASAALVMTLMGGVLVLNSFVAQRIFAQPDDKPGMLNPYAAMLALAGAVLLGAPMVTHAVVHLWRGAPHMDELVALALVAAIAIGKYQEAGVIAFFVLLGNLIETRTALGARASIESLIRLTPTRACRLTPDGSAEEVDVADLRPGDVIRVRPGDNIPADGEVIVGDTRSSSVFAGGCAMKHIFGPVPSRRLGRSLGIDVVPFKTCSYDCIYCQLGRTTRKTVERREWLRWEPLLAELNRSLDTRPDYITFSGSGEPTLHAGLGELIDRIKSVTSIPIAVLTNGSLLWRADVRRDLQHADLVIPSLDAGDDLRFRCINRPHESLAFEQVVEGLVAFREEFAGQYWLEVLAVGRWNSGRGHMERIAAWAKKIRPDRVQLNTVTRPPTEPWAERVPRPRLQRLASLFEPRAEIIDEYAQPPLNDQAGSGADRILDTLYRRPCTIEDVMAAHGLHRSEVVKYLDELVRGGLVERVAIESDFYYRAIRPPEAGHAGATAGDDV